MNGDINSGLGRWTDAEVADFLRTGKNRFGTAFGTMVEVVNSSTQYMTDNDLKAMSVFLKSMPPEEEEGAEPYKYDEASAKQLASLKFSQRGSQEYFEFCVSCHGYNGRGAGVLMPSLAGNPVVLDPRPESLINLTVNGSLRLVTKGNAETFDMPPFHILMSNQRIADVVTYIRTAWGHSGSEVTAEQVANIRAATTPVSSDDIVVLRMK